MKCIIIGIAFLLGVEGCSIFKTTSEGYPTPKVDYISPDLASESFLGVLPDSNGIIRIDSNGSFKMLASLQDSIRYYRIHFLSDSVLLYEDAESRLFLYNFYAKTRIPVLCHGEFTSLSNNRKYFATQIGQYPNYGVALWQLNPDRGATLIGEMNPNWEVISEFGMESFLMLKESVAATNTMKRHNDTLFVMKPDMSILGNVLNNYDFWPVSGWKENEIILSETKGNPTIYFITYDFITQKVDTITNLDTVTAVTWPKFALPNSKLYLAKGYMSDEEAIEGLNKRSEEIADWKRKDPGRDEHSVAWLSYNYWMIGDCKTKKRKKIGFQHFDAVVSLSGRHILFYKRNGDNYRMKVVSVKELVEGG